MAGLNPEDFKNTKPVLKQYWIDDKILNKKTIAIWPFAGYGRDLHRSPDKNTWITIINELTKNYDVIHFGADIEPVLSNSNRYKKLTNLPLFEQIKITLTCNFCLGTDSGSMWIIAAYNKIPQINLITNHLSNHHKNFMALAPLGEKSYNIFCLNGFSNIQYNEIHSHINQNLI